MVDALLGARAPSLFFPSDIISCTDHHNLNSSPSSYHLTITHFHRRSDINMHTRRLSFDSLPDLKKRMSSSSLKAAKWIGGKLQSTNPAKSECVTAPSSIYDDADLFPVIHRGKIDSASAWPATTTVVDEHHPYRSHLAQYQPSSARHCSMAVPAIHKY